MVLSLLSPAAIWYITFNSSFLCRHQWQDSAFTGRSGCLWWLWCSCLQWPELKTVQDLHHYLLWMLGLDFRWRFQMVEFCYQCSSPSLCFSCIRYKIFLLSHWSVWLVLYVLYVCVVVIVLALFFVYFWPYIWGMILHAFGL